MPELHEYDDDHEGRPPKKLSNHLEPNAPKKRSNAEKAAKAAKPAAGASGGAGQPPGADEKPTKAAEPMQPIAPRPPDFIDPRTEQVDEVEASRAPLLEHLTELRNRLVWVLGGVAIAFGIGLYFSNDLFQLLARPYAMAVADKEGARMIFTGMMEKFIVNIKVSLYAALLVTFPLAAIQIWKFVAPGLYKNERAAFGPFLVATPILFSFGILLAYFIVIPWALGYLLSFEESAPVNGIAIEAEAKVDQYLGFVMRMIFAFGVAFLMPVALTLLGKAGIISAQWLRERRRYAIVLTFVMAAVLTPPDPVSQIALGIPILLLYEVSIILIRLSEKRREKAEKAEKAKKAKEAS